MSVAQYLRILRHHWLIVAALSLLGLLAAGAYAWAQTPVYSASAQLFVSTSGQGADISALSQGGTFSQGRVKSYTSLVSGPDVLGPVIETLGLPYTVQDLAQRVSASSPLDTVLLDLTVTDSSPERARDIANAIAARFPAVVAALETTPGEAASPVTLSVTQQAVAATAPISPRLTLDLALGLLVGLGFGIGVAVLRDSLDRRIRSKSQAARLAGAPVLAVIVDDPIVQDAPLITQDAFSARAEAFRQLRTNIRFLSVDQRLRSLVVTGSVEGEGKTTTACNLAIALTQAGEDVVLIDADLRRPTIADVFALPSGVGLTSVLLGDVPLHAALHIWRDDVPLRVLTAGPLPPNPSELIGSSSMATLVATLTDLGTTVVIDSPPLLPVTDAAVLARVTDGALLVTRVASTRTDQLAAAVDALRIAGATVLGVVLNRMPRGRSSSYGAYGGYAGYGRYGSTIDSVDALDPVDSLGPDVEEDYLDAGLVDAGSADDDTALDGVVVVQSADTHDHRLVGVMRATDDWDADQLGAGAGHAHPDADLDDQQDLEDLEDPDAAPVDVPFFGWGSTAAVAAPLVVRTDQVALRRTDASLLMLAELAPAEVISRDDLAGLRATGPLRSRRQARRPVPTPPRHEASPAETAWLAPASDVLPLEREAFPSGSDTLPYGNGAIDLSAPADTAARHRT